MEYYLRPKVAFDLGVRYLDLAGPGSDAGFDSDRLRYVAIWAGHLRSFLAEPEFSQDLAKARSCRGARQNANRRRGP